MYSRRRNFYKCQAMVIKFGGNVNDRCGNLTKKTELKSADSEYHLVIISELFDQDGINMYQFYVIRSIYFNKFIQILNR